MLKDGLSAFTWPQGEPLLRLSGTKIVQHLCELETGSDAGTVRHDRIGIHFVWNCVLR